MKIMLNGAETEIAAARLADALVELGYADAVVATAVNEEFVPKEARAEHEIAPGDRLEVVAPLRGG